MQSVQVRSVVLTVVLLAGVLVAYANHFENTFHFDDSHAVVDNPYIRDLRNVPLFFADAKTFSNLPANRTYRPLVTLSLAIDYWIAKGLKPIYFQASTFVWFLVQLLLMQALFRKICDTVFPHPGNQWVTWFAAALYGLHPANAETVNYVIQRGDVYSTLGVVSGIAIYVLRPRWRRSGIYLLPVAAGLLSKPPALVFPAILFVYIVLFENAKPREALKKCLLSLAVVGFFAILTAAMTPRSFTPTAGSAYAYRITQPVVALRYLRNFFLPNRLSADTDFTPIASIFDGYALVGFVFIGMVVLAAWWCGRKREWRPVAFGLWWFLLALLPTALFPLAEVENDHRMYFPFVGLVIAACWPVALWLYRMQSATLRLRMVTAASCVLILAAAATGVRERNRVWRTDESLFYDVTVKSPHNGRGLMNYGLTQMSQGKTERALDYFERALVWTPNYYSLEINLGIANGLLNRVDAERHFQRAIELDPQEAASHYFYARWLNQKGRGPDALTHLQLALTANPDHLPSRYLLMECAASQGDWARVSATAATTLQLLPSDPMALRYLSMASAARPVAQEPQSPQDYLNLSLRCYREARYRDSIAAANAALRLKPDYAEAYSNVAAAYAAMQQWDDAIRAAREAVKLNPDFQLARNNLAWAEEQKRKRATMARG